MPYKDRANRKSNQVNLGTIHCLKLITAILEYHRLATLQCAVWIWSRSPPLRLAAMAITPSGYRVARWRFETGTRSSREATTLWKNLVANLRRRQFGLGNNLILIFLRDARGEYDGVEYLLNGGWHRPATTTATAGGTA